MSDLNLALIGNCSYAALIDQQARVVWACLPRFDADPVFSALLNGDITGESRGFYDIEVKNFSHGSQEYLPNTAILRTILHDGTGGAVEITDFAPRFEQFGRIYRPVMLVRHIRPLAGNPVIRVRLRPGHSYGAGTPETTHGSNHIRYVAPELTLRLTTDLPVAYILDEISFLLDGRHTLILGPDESLSEAISDTGRAFFENTRKHWHKMARHLAIPFEWQEEVIRAAITLKLCSFEESGAILAGVTTSIPEAANSERNWDYRFCWLRDSYFVVQALNRLGITSTMEDYVRYILNIASATDGKAPQPVYGITLDTKLSERTEPYLSGYRGMGPVRAGNQAYEQVQNDVYGSIILTATMFFFDQRLAQPDNLDLYETLEALGHHALDLFQQPDAGLWELRNDSHIHTFSSVMCWAACDRLARIATRLDLTPRTRFWRQKAEHMRKVILEEAWNADLNSFVESFDGDELDASLLLLHELGFVEATDPRFIGTVEAIEKQLRCGDFLFRYAKADDIGKPKNAFLVCTFWYIDALAAIGRKAEARELFENMLAHRNHAGLLSEDIDPETGELWGNFPQTYSMVGLIKSAMRLSKSWEEAF